MNNVDLKITWYILFVLLVFWSNLLGQGPNKRVSATRTSEKISIDGTMAETSWRNAEVATDFLERNPTEGRRPKFRTEVRILYDHDNIYILGYCYDSHPDSILTQLGERDDRLNADLFSVFFDTYNNMLDAFRFSVSSSGVQSDSRTSDSQFNAVWESAVQIVEDGWIAEI